MHFFMYKGEVVPHARAALPHKAAVFNAVVTPSAVDWHAVERAAPLVAHAPTEEERGAHAIQEAAAIVVKEIDGYGARTVTTPIDTADPSIARTHQPED